MSSGQGPVVPEQEHDQENDTSAPGTIPAFPVRLDFEAIFHSSPNAYMVLDRNLKFVAANDSYLRSVGGARWEDIQGRNLFDAFPSNPDDPDDIGVRQVRASLHRVLEKREMDHLAVVPYTIPVRTAEGVVQEERYWSATHSPILDEQGEVAYILQHTVDVTELQQMKKALRAAEAASTGNIPAEQVEQGVFRRAQLVQAANQILETELRHFLKLFEQAPGFLAILTGPNHVFSLVNAAYSQLVGHREVIRKPLREALPEVKGQVFVELLDQVYTSGEPYVGRAMRILLQRRPGAPLDKVYVDFVYQPIFEQDGAISGIFVQGHDVTEEVRAHEELKQLNSTLEQRVKQRTEALEARNNELQQFAYIASHDMQEPLRKIQTFADLARTDFGDLLGQEGCFYLERIEDAAGRMSQILSDLLTFSRLATRQEPVTWTSVQEIMRAVLTDLDMTITQTSATIEVNGDTRFQADTNQLRQLLNHLVINAIKFKRPDVPPSIRIFCDGTDPEGKFCRITVEDNGIGFDEKYAERIFQPFERLHGKAAYPGTGMGLAICKRITERHRGTIRAESTPGKGSRFIVHLPIRHLDEPS